MNLSFIKKRLQKNGVVGLGGGGFPSFLKIDKNIETFIINGAECEPLLKSDYFYLKNNLKKILEIANLYREILNLKRVFFAIKGKNLHLLSEVNLKDFGIEPFLLDDFYPVGDEKILIKLLDDLLIPHGKFPKDFRYLVQNVSTCGAIYDAIFLDKPLTKRYVTVTGEVKKPYVAEVKIGTPIYKLIEMGGIENFKYFEIIEGGIMTGQLSSVDDFINKTTGGVFLLPDNHRAVVERKQKVSYTLKSGFEKCCDCDKCTELCSRANIGLYLKPDRIVKNYGKYFEDSVFNCSNCGLCSLFSCPFELSPRNVINFLKKNFKGNGDLKRVNIKGEARDIQVSSDRLKKRLNLEKYDVDLKFIGEINFKTEFKIDLPKGTKWKDLKIGDSVKEFEPLNEILENYGYNVHSPVNGKIDDVGEKFLKIKN